MPGDFEKALVQTESDAVATARAADVAAKSARRLTAAARTGDLAALERAIAETDRALQALRLQFNNTKDGWTFEAAKYAEAGSLTEELKTAAAAAGLAMYEQDGRLFSYPVLIRVLPARADADLAISIDKKKIKALRPSRLIAQLLSQRDKPPKFDPKAFLEALYKAYVWAIKDTRSQSTFNTIGPSIELMRIYELLTLFPGQSRDYSRQEFARDVYLLDRSGARSTSAGAKIELSGSTGTRGSRARLLEIVDEQGSHQVYYAIAFTKAATP